MQITVQNLVVDRDMVLKPSQQVWMWEVPVLQAKYGESKVRLTDTAKVERNGLPSPGEEFVRLVQAHGIDNGSGGTNLPYAELAYGRGKAAITALAKVIKGSAKKPRIAKKPSTAKKPDPAPAPKAEEGEGDPLGMD